MTKEIERDINDYKIDPTALWMEKRCIGNECGVVPNWWPEFLGPKLAFYLGFCTSYKRQYQKDYKPLEITSCTRHADGSVEKRRAIGEYNYSRSHGTKTIDVPARNGASAKHVEVTTAYDGLHGQRQVSVTHVQTDDQTGKKQRVRDEHSQIFGNQTTSQHKILGHGDPVGHWVSTRQVLRRFGSPTEPQMLSERFFERDGIGFEIGYAMGVPQVFFAIAGNYKISSIGETSFEASTLDIPGDEPQEICTDVPLDFDRLAELYQNSFDLIDGFEKQAIEENDAVIMLKHQNGKPLHRKDETRPQILLEFEVQEARTRALFENYRMLARGAWQLAKPSAKQLTIKPLDQTL